MYSLNLWELPTFISFRRKAVRLLIDLSVTFGAIPAGLLVTCTISDKVQIGFGGFSDVFLGDYCGEAVVLKALKVDNTSYASALKVSITLFFCNHALHKSRRSARRRSFGSDSNTNLSCLSLG